VMATYNKEMQILLFSKFYALRFMVNHRRKIRYLALEGSKRYIKYASAFHCHNIYRV
jgi:hypothetical protein